jgi:hypothetical protein
MPTALKHKGIGALIHLVKRRRLPVASRIRVRRISRLSADDEATPVQRGAASDRPANVGRVVQRGRVAAEGAVC